LLLSQRISFKAYEKVYHRHIPAFSCKIVQKQKSTMFI